MAWRTSAAAVEPGRVPFVPVLAAGGVAGLDGGMSCVTAAEMRALEEAAFRRGVSAEALMDEAGVGIAQRLIALFPRPGTAVAYLGKGNNAGDALVALRVLRDEAGWTVSIRAGHEPTLWTVLARRKLRELGEVSAALPALPVAGPLLLLDGLLGIGAGGALREPLAGLAQEMERLRRDHGATVAAIDLPSGLDATTGESAGEGVTADLTLTIGAPKRGLFTPAGIGRAGRIVLVPVANLPPPEAGPRLFCPDLFPGLLAPRPHDFHKGDAGRIGILAGSPGMTGAAVLCATAALRAGAGLISLHVTPDLHPLVAATLPPEVMVRPEKDPVAGLFAAGHDAIVAGPGLAHLADPLKRALLDCLETDDLPAVLDADALNALAAAGRSGLLRPSHLITPHPGEFARLAPDLKGLPREEAVEAFTSRHRGTLLLKGARTLIGRAGEPIRINPTGHPGMASGGQGDVLAGVAGALLAGGADPLDAGALAAWLCGRAAELALDHGPFTTAGDTLRHLGGALRDWQGRRR